MLRSGATSPLVRCLGYAFTVECVLLFGYAFFTTIWAALTVDPVEVRAWLLIAATLCLAFVAAATRYVMRRSYSGGHFLVALACLAATFACLVSLIPLLWVQN
jgi:hypothetical protein